MGKNNGKPNGNKPNGKNGKPNGGQKPRTSPRKNGRGSQAMATMNVSTMGMSLNTVTKLNRGSRGSRVPVGPSTDFFGRVTVKANPVGPTDRILATIPINPSAFSGTRLATMSQLWERYRFEKLNLRYIPAVPNTVACQLMLYIDTDPNDDPTTIPDVDSLIRQGVAQEGSVQWNFNSPAEIPLVQRGDDQMYYTGDDKQNERFSRQGTAYLIQVTRPMNFNGQFLSEDLECGSIFFDWKCLFGIDQINPEGVIIPSVTESLSTATDEDGVFSINGGSIELVPLFVLNNDTDATAGISLTHTDGTTVQMVETTSSGANVEIFPQTLKAGDWSVSYSGTVNFPNVTVWRVTRPNDVDVTYAIATSVRSGRVTAAVRNVEERIRSAKHVLVSN